VAGLPKIYINTNANSVRTTSDFKLSWFDYVPSYDSDFVGAGAFFGVGNPRDGHISITYDGGGAWPVGAKTTNDTSGATRAFSIGYSVSWPPLPVDVEVSETRF
jgi:hypothetical protein